jgi:urease accessory protein
MGGQDQRATGGSEPALAGLQDLALCQLLTLADSALPIGGLAQSFGLEQAVASGQAHPGNLRLYVESWCDESLRFEAASCAAGHRLARDAAASEDDGPPGKRWRELNERLSAFKIARESRVASLRLGGRFLELAKSFTADMPSSAPPGACPRLRSWLDGGGHLAPAFGVVAASLGIGERAALVGFSSQSVAALVSAAQRLMPLGQKAAMELIWRMKPCLAAIASEISAAETNEILCFSPAAEAASMAHPYLPVRLFLS